ncbi:SAF domain-containing protein [Actinotalea ferrariae]|uniref:SAF domain-containing protein n=1 Tax=Actinotalea ferrariae TaxID=1386098 RepID=UPI0027DEF04A|nr:SAF domain-containing protein [Actinotalea ferrariae]
MATRLRRPGWRDPRLLVGLVLVAASVALGAWAVGAAGRTVPVYAAVGSLVPGEVLDADSVEVREVRLGAAGPAYLSADEPLPDGLVVQRTVAAGELVPRSALSAVDELAVRPVAVAVPGVLPEGLVAGSAVDLWFVPEDATAVPAGAGSSEGAAPTPPRGPYELAAGLTVAEVAKPEGAFAVGGTTTVHVLVPVDRLTEVLAATAAEGDVQVVVVPGLAAS